MKRNRIAWVLVAVLALAITLSAARTVWNGSADGYIVWNGQVVEPWKAWQAAIDGQYMSGVWSDGVHSGQIAGEFINSDGDDATYAGHWTIYVCGNYVELGNYEIRFRQAEGTCDGSWIYGQESGPVWGGIQH